MTADVDFHYIPPAQEAIHKRLLNWSRWLNSPSKTAGSPMFASYRSTEVWASPEESHPVDSLGAQMVERAVARLGAVQRSALRWHYIKPVSPHRLAQALGLTKAGLAQAVIDARSHVQSLLTHRVNPVSSP